MSRNLREGKHPISHHFGVMKGLRSTLVFALMYRWNHRDPSHDAFAGQICRILLRLLHLRFKWESRRVDDLQWWCETVARIGGDELMKWQNKIHAREKAPNDLVTEADLASQRAIRRVVAEQFPDHDFLGEETDPEAIETASGAEYRWVVDPLDGTANYVHGLPNFAVSVAVERRGEVQAGVVYDPTTNECFSAALGKPALLNGQPIRPSDCARAGDAMVAASFSAKVPRNSPELLRFIEALHNCQGIRRFGSAALNLCYVACGRLDAYWATSVRWWDVAAGLLVVRQAGGATVSMNGGEFRPERPEILASATPALQQEMLGLFRAIPSS
jgi:myo-inositol-1(or 4)-monophosphatase